MTSTMLAPVAPVAPDPLEALLDAPVRTPPVLPAPPAAPAPRVRATPIRPQPVAPPVREDRSQWHFPRPSVLTREKLNDAALTAAWIPPLAVASVIGAIGLAVGQPIVLVNELRRERRYR